MKDGLQVSIILKKVTYQFILTGIVGFIFTLYDLNDKMVI